MISSSMTQKGLQRTIREHEVKYTCPYCKNTVPFNPVAMFPHQHSNSAASTRPLCMNKATVPNPGGKCE